MLNDDDQIAEAELVLHYQAVGAKYEESCLRDVRNVEDQRQ